MTCLQSLEPKLKERSDLQKLSSDLHVYSVTRMGLVYTDTKTHTHTPVQGPKLRSKRLCETPQMASPPQLNSFFFKMLLFLTAASGGKMELPRPRVCGCRCSHPNPFSLCTSPSSHTSSSPAPPAPSGSETLCLRPAWVLSFAKAPVAGVSGFSGTSSRPEELSEVLLGQRCWSTSGVHMLGADSRCCHRVTPRFQLLGTQ